MPTGNKQGVVHDVFKKRLKNLQGCAQKIYDGFTGSGQRVWDIPEDLSAASLFEIASLHKPSFDRESINTNFKEAIASAENPGTVGDVIGLTLQCDYNAAEERAFRFRHASPVRCFAHSAARQKGRAKGPVLPRIEEDAANSIAAGAT